MASRSTTASAPSAPNYTGPFIVVTGLFLIFGFLTNLNSNLSPKLEDIFHLSHAWSNLVTTSWFFAYLVFSVPASKVIEKVGYKRTMVISLFVMVVGALLFVPAANLVSFPLFLTASFVLATGVCGLQTSANPYVSILGPESSAPARLTLAQAFNSLGTAMAPIVVGVFILTDPAKVKDQAAIAHTVQAPYIAIACALLALAFIIMGMHLPAITGTRDFRPAQGADAIAGRSIWTYRHTVLAMIGIFLYVGLEIALAANAIKFFETQGSAMDDYLRWAQPFAHAVSRFYPQGIGEKEVAAGLAFCYPLAMMIGRFAGTVLMKTIKANKLLAYPRRFGSCPDGRGDVLDGPRRHLELDPLRLRQLHHVSDHLRARHRRIGSADQQGLGRDHDRQFRWSSDSAALRADRRQSGLPARISAGHRLLPVHDLLRRVGIQTGSLGCRLGFLQRQLIKLSSPPARRRACCFCRLLRRARQKSRAAAGVSGHRTAGSLPQTATGDCTAPRQELQRIATRFARERDNLNRPEANAAARNLKKYD